ncbi:hypothetical protein VNO80_06351 [Phaseolus coccineus]|uniref:Uncharacterized protein n=1 Tax=Phaseolus coccineus TaxID=3886 RepID=A0AAN9NGQ0_PHACN
MCIIVGAVLQRCCWQKITQSVGRNLVTGATVHSFLDLEKVCDSGERGKGCACQFLTSAEVTSCSFCLVWCGMTKVISGSRRLAWFGI